MERNWEDRMSSTQQAIKLDEWHLSNKFFNCTMSTEWWYHFGALSCECESFPEKYCNAHFAHVNYEYFCLFIFANEIKKKITHLISSLKMFINY